MQNVTVVELSVMLGHTMASVEGKVGAKEMLFTSTNGTKFLFSHDQEGCEVVNINDVVGDISDLVGAPLLVAEEVRSPDSKVRLHAGSDEGSHTWTFYRFATVKGTVTVRWLGESNGWYSEDVELIVVKGNS